MEAKIYRERLKNKIFLIIMAWPAGFVTISRTFIVRNMSIKENLTTILIAVSVAILLLLLICMLGIKRIIISEDYFTERKWIGRRCFYYDKIETCFYDSTRDCICLIYNGKSKTIMLENYDHGFEILCELQKHMSVEMIG